jgi:IPT/TIG domain
MSTLANSSITITFPSGTVLSNVNSSQILTADNTKIGSCSVSQANLTATCEFFNNETVGAGTPLTVQLGGVANTTVTGSQSLSVQTTSDPTPVNGSFSVVANNPVTNVSVTSTAPTDAASARTVYLVAFDTSPTGGMSTLANSSITITFPSGTVLSNVNSSQILTADNTNIGSCSVSQANLTATCEFFNNETVEADTPLTVELGGVTNPPLNPTGGEPLHIQTTSDITPATGEFPVVSNNPVTNVSVTNTAPTDAAAARTVYSITFDTSSTGSMSTLANSSITITFPSGTVLSNVNSSQILTADNTNIGSCSVSQANLTATCEFFNNETVDADTPLTVQVGGVVNPSTVGAETLSVQTTSDSTSVTSAQYTIGSAPTITGISPVSGPTSGGAIVTITGTNLTAATAVKFGTVNATSFAVNTATSITATAPAAAASTVDVTVTTPVGTSATSAADQFTYISPPTVTGINPTAGATAGGSSVTITGTNFTGATGVSFGSTAATSFTVNGATSITATTPAGSAGTVDVTVTTPGGTSATTAADRYTYAAAPTVTGLNPTAGPTAGGTTVTITGTNLTGATAVTFGAANATSFTVNSATTITATAPTHTAAGTVDVTVTTPGGTTATTAADRYTYAAAPTVTGLNPTAGPTAGGTTVTITGTNLTGATAVEFGTTSATITANTATTITATAPAGTVGTVDVTVTTPGGTTATSAADRYTYNAPAPASPPASPPPAPPASSPPVVASGVPTIQTTAAAGLSGSVDPENLATTAFFQYGLDPSERGPGSPSTLYDQSTPPQQVGSDSASHTVSASLTGLIPGALYHIRLVATNSAGTTFGTDQTFTTPQAAAPPPPVLGQSENAQPVSGTVFIKSPSGTFVRLTGAEKIPSGAEIDALHGSLQITTATAKKGKTQKGVFGGAVFKLTQASTGASTGLTTLSIVENAFTGAPSYALCTKHNAADATAASVKTLQLLHASAKGKFRTKGRYSAATVLGTIWTIADRCDGTLVHDVTDSVAVSDFVRHKTVIIHGGQSYLALAPGHRR